MRILCIFTNLMDIWGPKAGQSHVYLWISWIFWIYEAQISWIFVNLMDIPKLWSANLLDIWGLWSKISLILGPMKSESHGYLQISRTFMNLLNIWGLWSTNLLDSWGLWSTNLQDICKSLGYSVDNLIRKKSQDPIGLQRQGVIVNYIQKFQVATMSLEVA